MRLHRILAMVRTLAVPAFMAGAALAMLGEALAHENHAPLPTKGVTIAGDTIMLSDKAREAIGLTTAKVQLSDIHRIVTVNARVELPWHAQAMITSLVPGKIDQVLVRPGETVAPGQELARVVSVELESLQLSLLQAQAEVDLARKLVEQRRRIGPGRRHRRQDPLGSGGRRSPRSRPPWRSPARSWRRLGSTRRRSGTSRRLVSGCRTCPSPVRSAESSPTPMFASGRWSAPRTISTTSSIRRRSGSSATCWNRTFASWPAASRSSRASPRLPGEEFRGQIDHLRLKMDPQRRTQGVVDCRGEPRAASCGRGCPVECGSRSRWPRRRLSARPMRSSAAAPAITCWCSGCRASTRIAA